MYASGRDASPHADPADTFLDQRLVILNERHEAARAEGNYFFGRALQTDNGAWVNVDGQRMLMMASYSYLGLIGHQRIDSAAQQAISRFGTGTHGVRLLAGTIDLHRELEAKIAEFKSAEEAIVFSSGYVANIATISTLMAKGSVVICDKLDHASIIDGCILSRSKLMFFDHNDMADLEHCLSLNSNSTAVLVIVDAVFSMDGDIINLPAVSRLCRRYGASLMVDEAHSLGVLGASGRGIEEHYELEPDVVDVKMGTLSKAVPSIGGYVAGTSALVSALRHNARAFVFSASLPPPQVAAAIAAFDVIQDEPDRLQRLRRLTRKYVDGLASLGFNTLATETAIVPIVCGTEGVTAAMTHACHEQKLFVLPIVYPAVPAKTPRLRTTVTAAHTDDDIEFALAALAFAGRSCGLI